MTAALGDKVKLVGDDLFVTNEKILKRGIDNKEANAILVKVNQIGTLTETFSAMDLAFKNNFIAIISHRSGETGDHFIADLAVAQVVLISKLVPRVGQIVWRNIISFFELKNTWASKQSTYQLNNFLLRSDQ